MDHARCCLWGTKSRPWQAERQDRQVAAPIGNDNSQSGLCKANTPAKVALPASHIFRGKEGLYQELLKRCPLEGIIHCHPGNLKDGKESLTVQTLHSQRCKNVVLQVLFRVFVLQHEARVVTMTE